MSVESPFHLLYPNRFAGEFSAVELRDSMRVRDVLLRRSNIAQNLAKGVYAVDVEHLTSPTFLHDTRFALPLWKHSQLQGGVREGRVELPGIAETQYATYLLEQTAMELKRQFYGSVSGMVCIGSLAWGAYYAPKMAETGTAVGSDLDFELVLGNTADWDDIMKVRLVEGNGELRDGLMHFRSLYERRYADYFSHKITLNGVDISLHFTPFETIRRVCWLPTVALGFETADLTELRVQPKKKAPIYSLRTFTGEEHEYVAQPETQDAGSLLTDIPFYAVYNGEMAPGVVTDKYLHHPRVLFDEVGVQMLFSQLHINMVRRALMEERELGGVRWVAGVVSRVYRTPWYILEEMLQRDAEIRRILNV